MTKEQRIEKSNEGEKHIFNSKKAALVLLVEIGLFVMAILALRWQQELGWPLAAFMVSIVFSMSFILFVYTGKQSMIDAYVRGIALTGEAPKSLHSKITKELGLGGQENDSSSTDSKEN